MCVLVCVWAASSEQVGCRSEEGSAVGHSDRKEEEGEVP